MWIGWIVAGWMLGWTLREMSEEGEEMAKLEGRLVARLDWERKEKIKDGEEMEARRKVMKDWERMHQNWQG
jgi:hypothetical protein